MKFDAFIKGPLRRTRETISPASTENEDEDEKTNRIASRRPSKTIGQSLTPQYPLSPASEARRPHSTGSETDSSDGGVDLPPGCWVVDGDVTNMSSIEIRFASNAVCVCVCAYLLHLVCCTILLAPCKHLFPHKLLFNRTLCMHTVHTYVRMSIWLAT